MIVGFALIALWAVYEFHERNVIMRESLAQQKVIADERNATERYTADSIPEVRRRRITPGYEWK